ncbi:MAG: hypothetical protein WB992_00940 [Bryobacteraceae bacterium]
MRLLTVLLGAGALAVAQADATTITTTSYSTWASSTYTAAGSQFELNFSPIQNISYDTSTGIILYGITHSNVGFDFTGPDNGGYNLTGSTSGTTSLKGASDGVGTIYVAAPSGGANALLLGIGGTGSTPLTLTFSDGESFSGLSPGSLFGFSISHSITWLTLSTASGSQPIIDDFYYGASSLPPDPPPTIEGATFALVGGGLLILFGSRRRLLRKFAS